MCQLRVVFSFLLLSVFVTTSLSAEQHKGRQQGVIHIDTDKGNPLQEGVSGFNVRIADKVWNYTHPDFRDAVHRLHPGWLRFFSGTMGSAFNAATGQYDKDYAWMHDDQQQYFRGYAFTDVKGPHRISDLYALLGEIGGKLVVTINGFTETPEVTRELARFCKNNNIEVEVWQFCNEPYFYVPHRDRYWFNDGYDYAVKMNLMLKPFWIFFLMLGWLSMLRGMAYGLFLHLFMIISRNTVHIGMYFPSILMRPILGVMSLSIMPCEEQILL